MPDPAQPYAGGDQIGFAGRIRVNPAIAADPALLRDGTQAVAGSAGGPTAFTPNPAGGPAGFTTLLDRVLDFGFGAEAAAGQAWPGIATAGLGPDGTLASPFTAPATLEAYAGRVTAAQTGDRAAATAAKDQAAGAEARRWRPASAGNPASTRMPRWPASSRCRMPMPPMPRCSGRCRRCSTRCCGGSDVR